MFRNLLSLVLFSLLMTGCGGGSDNSGSDGKGTQTDQVEAGNQDNQELPEAPPEIKHAIDSGDPTDLNKKDQKKIIRTRYR